MLEIKNLCKAFHKNKSDEKVIFEDFNLKIKSGEFVTIIGGNGAGKSTLMNLISGTIFPDRGKIVVEDRDVTKLPEHKRAKFIGRVFQDPLKGTAPSLTIEENLSLSMLRNSRRTLSFGVKKNNSEFFVKELEKLNLGLEKRLKTKVGLLSGGQRQALTLLMATITKPKILLLDEHTAALDPSSRDKILNLTNEIAKDEKMATLMITHNMEHDLNFGNRTIMLKQGNIVFDVKGEEREKLDASEIQNSFNF